MKRAIADRLVRLAYRVDPSLAVDTVPRETALEALELCVMDKDPHGWGWRARAESFLKEAE